MNQLKTAMPASHPSRANEVCGQEEVGRQSQVQEEFRFLRIALDTNGGLVNELEARLAAVLRVEPVDSDKGGGAPIMTLVPLADAVREHRMGVDGVNRRLAAIIQALEL